MANSTSDDEHVRRWEPMHAGVLPELRRLAASASRVEGDALARLGTTAVPVSTFPALVDAIDRVSPDGRPVTTFGAAFVFQGDRDDLLSPEAGQPARWWPLAQPPQRRREHLWDWMVEHLDGRPAGGR